MKRSALFGILLLSFIVHDPPLNLYATRQKPRLRPSPAHGSSSVSSSTRCAGTTLYRYYGRYNVRWLQADCSTKALPAKTPIISHLPAFTAVGHTTIFSGSVPAIDGIAGNDWIDQATRANPSIAPRTAFGTTGRRYLSRRQYVSRATFSPRPSPMN
jgi:hypothetical protein